MSAVLKAENTGEMDRVGIFFRKIEESCAFEPVHRDGSADGPAAMSSNPRESGEKPSLEVTPEHDEDQECARLQEALDVATADLEQKLEEAYEKGRAAGLEEATDDYRQRDATICDELRQTSARLSEEFEKLGELSVEIGRTAIETVLGDRSQRTEMVAEIAKHQVEAIRDNLIVAVRVSATDFVEGEALAEISARGVQVEATADLPSGACEVELVLGNIDAGLTQQSTALNALFDEVLGGRLAQ